MSYLPERENTLNSTPPLTPAELAEVKRFGLDRAESVSERLSMRSLQAFFGAHPNVGHSDPPAPISALKDTSAGWANRKGIYVLDAMGWDRSTPDAFDRSWAAQITERDFDERAARSVTRARSETRLAPEAATWKIRA